MIRERDKWKEDFLAEITTRFSDKVVNFGQTENYRLKGVPFYNSEGENRFRDSLFEALEMSV